MRCNAGMSIWEYRLQLRGIIGHSAGLDDSFNAQPLGPSGFRRLRPAECRSDAFLERPEVLPVDSGIERCLHHMVAG